MRWKRLAVTANRATTSVRPRQARDLTKSVNSGVRQKGCTEYAPKDLLMVNPLRILLDCCSPGCGATNTSVPLRYDNLRSHAHSSCGMSQAELHESRACHSGSREVARGAADAGPYR